MTLHYHSYKNKYEVHELIYLTSKDYCIRKLSK